MRHLRLAVPVAIFFVAMLPLLSPFLGCTRSENAKAPVFLTGQMPFVVDPTQITQLDIAKNDPNSGDVWTASMKKTGEHDWEVLSAPGGKPLLDRRAAGGFIFHLLDTLKTVQVASIAPEAPLESYGLKPPRFALRWTAPSFEKSDAPTVSEIEFGSAAKSGAEGTYAKIGGKVYTVKGAALQMLAYVESFSSLREQIWLAPIASDDVDEIELVSAGRKFYAQREGDVWTDEKHKPIPASRGNMGAFLEKLTHMRVQEFVDDSARAAQARSTIEKKSLYAISLRDRQGKETKLRLQWITWDGQEGAYGVASSRPQSVVRVFAELMRDMEPLARR